MKLVEIIVLILLLVLTISGYIRGIIKMFVSVAAFAAALIITMSFHGVVRDALIGREAFYNNLKGNIEKIVDKNISDEYKIMDEETIEKMLGEIPLPDGMKKKIGEPKELAEKYAHVTVADFKVQLTDKIASLVVDAISIVGTFIVIYVLLVVVLHVAGIIAKLPVLAEVNKMAGAALGLLEGVCFVWVLMTLLTAFTGTDWGANAMQQIKDSAWLSVLYTLNPFVGLLG